jgi:RecA/RadA recombinase
MGKLMNSFEAAVSKMKTSGVNQEAEFDVMYPTGFLAIDYLNGTVIHVESKDRNFTYNAVGIVDGSTNTIIGRSGSGKSTLLNQISGNLVRPFINKGMDANLFIDDIEGSLPQSRKEFLLGLTEEQIQEHVKFRNSGITSQNLYQRIKQIHDDKIKNRADVEYDTGLYDTYGKRIFKLVPTVYIVDSLPMLLPENLVEDEDLGSSMDASAVAKTNTMLFKKISQLCKEANIIFFTINHILDEIQMGFIPKAAQISGLKQGERLPGGRAALYLANNMFRTDDSKTLKKDKDYGIDGSIVTLTLVKSRTNATKRAVPLIFNKTEGRFDEILSLFELLKSEGCFSGAGAFQYIESEPNIKFSAKTFKKTFEESPELQKAVAVAAYNLLSGFLSETRRANALSDSALDNLNSLVANMGNSQTVA